MQFTQVLARGFLFASAAYAATVEVDVGDGALKMKPDSVTANVGDIVQFNFYPPQHSVVQAAFDKPCQPLDGGFFSGIIATSSGESDKVFQINITSTDPIWYYCEVASHCPSGMVGVINPPSSGNTIDAFTSAAKSATVGKSSSNGPTGGIITTPGGNSSSSASPSGSATGSSSTPSGSAAASSTSKAAAAAVTEHAGLILPALFAAVGLVF